MDLTAIKFNPHLAWTNVYPCLNACLASYLLPIILQVPKNFKPLTNRAQKMFRKLLDPEPSKRLELGETVKFMEDKWLRKGAAKEPGKDGQSQLTLGSFQVKI